MKLESYAVEMLHITKRFPGIIANDDITLQLKKGEIHALLGENGAGKSTLLSILAGVQPADGGEFLYEDKDLFKYSYQRTELVGYVPQGTPLIEELNAKDNLCLWYDKKELEKEELNL